jgi:hypothetical protein
MAMAKQVKASLKVQEVRRPHQLPNDEVKAGEKSLRD